MSLINSIENAERILIVGHMRPDGDCIGAGLAVRKLALNYGKAADLVYDSAMPAHYSFVKNYDCINNPQQKSYDLLIVVDCGDNLRMGKYLKYLGKIKSIQIDHHITNNKFADENFVYPEKSSTCEILADMLLPIGKVDNDIAECLYIGLSTDTGHFMHNNTKSATLKTVAKLMEIGIDAYSINIGLYRSLSIQKTKLISRAINSMRFFAENKICIISIMLNDLEATGCDISDTEGLIDSAMNIESVQVAVCMTEQINNKYKVSFRSKGFNVAACATVFGGGGHTQAAGCVVCGMHEDVIRKVVKSILDGMEQ